jgi:hypothetical protein
MGETKEKTDNHSWKDRINFNTAVALFFILFSIGVLLLIPYQIEKPRLFMGRELMPLKPHWFPEVTLFGLLGLSVWYLIQSFRLHEENLFKELEKGGYARVIVTLVACVAFTSLLEPLGFVVSSTLLVLFLSIYYGNRNVFILITIIAVTVAIYLIFTRGLHVSLPESPFLF